MVINQRNPVNVSNSVCVCVYVYKNDNTYGKKNEFIAGIKTIVKDMFFFSNMLNQMVCSC